MKFRLTIYWTFSDLKMSQEKRSGRILYDSKYQDLPFNSWAGKRTRDDMEQLSDISSLLQNYRYYLIIPTSKIKQFNFWEHFRLIYLQQTVIFRYKRTPSSNDEYPSSNYLRFARNLRNQGGRVGLVGGLKH